MARFGEKELGAQELTSILETTAQYWRDWDAKAIPGSLKKYISTLLPHELKAARKIEAARKDEGKRLPDDSEKADTLVLLVGFSFEPLLQSVCAYKPKKVLLVLNDIYSENIDGQMIGDWLTKLIRKLPADLLPKQPEEIGAHEINDSTGEEQFITQPAQPEKVFQFLIDQLLRNPKADKNDRIVIDITGAKKSMVTGAYLFGALTNCTLSYVDFDAYEPERFRAYGYSCRIGKIGNPYHSFRIANWHRVQERYNHYALGEAADLLGEIIADFRETKLFEREDKKDEKNELGKLGQLKKVIEFYASWDAGDIPKAYEQWISEIKAMGIEAPMAIQVLGPEWKKVEQTASPSPAVGDFAESHGAMDKWASLLGTNHWQAMLAYAQDELAKIQRIFKLQGDARAAFIRAANLHEYTLKFRLLILTSIEDGIDVTSGDIFSVAFFKASLAILFSTDPSRGDILQKFHERNRIRIQTSPRLQSLNLKMFPGWDEILYTRIRNGEREDVRLVDQFREVRNATVHSLSVISEGAAKNAVKFIEKDWDNLLDPWAKLLKDKVNLDQFVKAEVLGKNLRGDTRFGLPLWKDLLGKNLCNIDFLPIFEDAEKPIQEQPS
jgi:hypothetical protein